MMNEAIYPALIDGEPGAYGVVFPDIDGIGAMGATVAEAVEHARLVLIDYTDCMAQDGLPLAVPSAPDEVAVPKGSRLTAVSLSPASASS